MKDRVLKIIRIYQKISAQKELIIATQLGSGSRQGSCRFRPTCSEYTYQAINRFGIVKGILLGGKRILRCHPFNKGGYDPVPTH